MLWRTFVITDEKKCALIVIDAQTRLMPVIHDRENVSRVILDMVKFANIVDMPIVVTEQQKLGDTLPEIQGEINDFQPITKISFSCFGCDEFRVRLDKLNVDALIITGVEAHICVAQTAFDVLEKYDVHVINDAVGARTIHNCNTALDRMRGEGVIISSKEMFFYEMLKTAGSPHFKKVLPLVK